MDLGIYIKKMGEIVQGDVGFWGIFLVFSFFLFFRGGVGGFGFFFSKS